MRSTELLVSLFSDVLIKSRNLSCKDEKLKTESPNAGRSTRLKRKHEVSNTMAWIIGSFEVSNHFW